MSRGGKFPKRLGLVPESESRNILIFKG